MEPTKYNSAGPSHEQGEHELPKPESCYQAGLECRACVRHASANLATVCRNLGPEALRDSFFKIYPDQACLPMARTFGRSYRAAQNALDDLAEEPADEYSLLAIVPA